MRKISTLFKKDPNDLGRVINEINPENAWVFNEPVFALATRKYDGSACAIIDGQLYKRYDVKKGKSVPPFSIPCQEPDAITGHWPHWVLCQHDKPEDKWFFEAFNSLEDKADGTYEMCGPKCQGNPEKFEAHVLVKHGAEILQLFDLRFEGIKQYLTDNDIEGIVFHHHIDGRMCKIRKSDFGIKRYPIIQKTMESKVKCPKCNSKDLFITELWKDSTIEWQQVNGEIDRKDGVLNAGYPYKLQGKCSNCKHRWKLRRVIQIDELEKR